MLNETTPVDQNDADLDYVREKRKMIINGLTKDGLPRSTMETQTVLMALADMDRAALSKKKIKVDKEIGTNTNQAMELIATLFADARLKKIGKTVEITNTLLPVLGDHIPLPETVDGEMDGVSTLENYESFMTKMNKE